MTPKEAKAQLDKVINKARIDLYKPIQVAEVLRQSRKEKNIDLSNVASFQNKSIQWRDVVTERLLGKVSTSSARYQHDIWNKSAIPPSVLKVLDEENKRIPGCVERYIYIRFDERQSVVRSLIGNIEKTEPKSFRLEELLSMFIRNRGIRRSIDKAYEIITYSLFETIISELKVSIKISVNEQSRSLLKEFEDLARVLIGIDSKSLTSTLDAHLYRVGVTNAADRGLDMWANYGPAIQVKHLTLDTDLAKEIVDQVESDHIVIVCKDTEAKVIDTITKQIGWGRRVKGIVRESDLIKWYDKCLRGTYADKMGDRLKNTLIDGFRSEFPQVNEIESFLNERNYLDVKVDILWRT